MRHLDLATLKAGVLAAGIPAARGLFIALAASLGAGLPAATSCAAPATWTVPLADQWLYPNGWGLGPSNPGTRFAGPTYTGNWTLDENDEFEALTSTHPSRLATSWIGFDTASQITSGLHANRYSIESVKLTVFLQGSSADPLIYRPQKVEQSEIHTRFVAGTLATDLPFELYGLGMQAGYTRFATGAAVGGNSILEERENPYSTGMAGVYPISSDGNTGAYVDVANSVTGGASATAPGNVTAPFTPEPWAIGTVNGLQPGEVVPENSLVEFSLKLDHPGVKAYLQEGLSAGQLGFVLSSLHLSVFPGSGDPQLGYPNWYLKEATFSIPPKLDVAYSILAPLAGGFDSDRDVDGDDLLRWQRTLGKTVPNGTGADGSGNGTVGPEDLLFWSQNYGHTGVVGAAGATPEPGGASLAAFAAAALGQLAGRRRRARTVGT